MVNFSYLCQRIFAIPNSFQSSRENQGRLSQVNYFVLLLHCFYLLETVSVWLSDATGVKSYG